MESSSRSAPRHVVVIEPDAAVSHAIRILLEDEGYRVTDCRPGAYDPTSVVSLAPDAVIFDFSYQAIDDDLTFLHRLRGDQQTATVPIVLCTGAIHTAKALSREISGLKLRTVFKPFHIGDFAATIAELTATTPTSAT
jgi:CheY-like chemotaxis protein